MLNNNSEKFKDFLISEYSNIAQAHFKSIETTSTFFRYYLLIMSIPISAVAIIAQISPDKDKLISLVSQYKLPISIVLFCISLIGLGMFCYIVNLRLDVILYARVVNGIRKFFYDKYDENINLKIRWRVLPQSPQLPSYFEKSFFLPVVFVFGVMNSLYCFFGGWTVINKELVGVTSGVFFLLHFIIYKWYSHHREITYIKSNILGIDIDGVLNKHHEHFCKILKGKTGKEIIPEKILIIPIHDYSDLNITREDEIKVFNEPKYWKEMPIIEDISYIIRSLHNAFKIKIYIFTYRPWPDSPNMESLIEKVRLFSQNSKDFSLKLLLLKIGIKLRFKCIVKRLKEEPLRLITSHWLKENKIIYNKLFLEKGNDYSSDSRDIFRNRFYISRKKKIRFFVEDDFEKAIKLSYICDIVFLISHPYNRPNNKLSPDINKLRESLPSNIIRVKSWKEIYQHIRRLS